MSGELPEFISCEFLCECPPDNEDIAESIDDVRGGARAISTLCAGATAAIDGRVPGGEPPDGFEFTTGSETLREVAFESWEGREYLNVLNDSYTSLHHGTHLDLFSSIESTEESSER
jgi:hypothetical protein